MEPLSAVPRFAVSLVHGPAWDAARPLREQEAWAEHATYMDERNIDVQIIGPRPFLVLGWMEPHLLPAWTRYVNDMIHQQCQMFPGRFLGAAMLPQVSDAPDLSNCISELCCVGVLRFLAR